MTEDMSIYFSSDDFGTVGVFYGDKINAITVDPRVEVDGILTEGYIDAHGVEGTRPLFVCAHSDVDRVERDTVAVIESITYKVKGIERSGALATVILERQD